MPQTLIKDLGGTIETYFETFRPGSCTVTLKTGDGSTKVDGVEATVDSVSTTVSSSVAAQATTLALSSATGVVAGRRYMLGLENSTALQEVVTVKRLDASTATLMAPTLYAHNSGDAFRCGRVTYAVSSSSADAVWFDGYADFDPDVGDTVTEVVDCALRKIPDNLIDSAYVLRIFPDGQKMLSGKLDLAAALRDARDLALNDVGGKVRVMAMIGNEDFRRLAGLTFWVMLRATFGDEWQATFDKLEADRLKRIAKMQSQVPVDADQDGTTTGPSDGGITSGRLQRS